MHLSFDPNLRKKYQSPRITDITIEITDTGCAGHKVSIAEHAPKGEENETYTSYEDAHLNIMVHYPEKYGPMLDGGQIAFANNRFYFVHDTVTKRCGCGTSIDFQSPHFQYDVSKVDALKKGLKHVSKAPHIKNMKTPKTHCDTD